MKSVGMVYNVRFQKLLEAVEQSGNDISKGVDAVICLSLYKTFRIAELSYSEHDRLGIKDISQFVELLSDLMVLACMSTCFASYCSSKYGMGCLVG